MKYKAVIKYDGSKFYGFQRLNNKQTVQGELEKALTKINKKQVLVNGSGRTDRGVHAIGQVVDFKIDNKVPIKGLKRAINERIHPSIHIIDINEINDSFHSRYDAKEKTYKYIINLGPYNPLAKDYIYQHNKPLNIKTMKKASKLLLGKHSYKAFVKGFRLNYNSEVKNITFKKNKDLLTITFTGRSFYRGMIRNLVGALFLVGKNKITILNIKEMLDKEENIYSYTSYPPEGLYLVDVKY